MPRSNETHPEPDDARHDEPTAERQDERHGDSPGAPAVGGCDVASCDDVLDRLELYLDTLDDTDGVDEGLPGLAGGERAAVESHLTRCPACAQELGRARRVRDGLRALPELPFAPETPGRREVAAGAPGPTRTPAWVRPGPWLRWAVPLAAAAVLALAILTTLPDRSPAPAPEAPATAAQASEVSPEELARAELEARYALARLAEATRRARREIRDDVLARHVLAPVQRELQRSFRAPAEIQHEDNAQHRKPATL
jgi:hypothetical protein